MICAVGEGLICEGLTGEELIDADPVLAEVSGFAWVFAGNPEVWELASVLPLGVI